MPRRSDYNWYVVGVPKQRRTLAGALSTVAIASVILGVIVIGNGDPLWGIVFIGWPVLVYGLWIWLAVRSQRRR